MSKKLDRYERGLLDSYENDEWVVGKVSFLGVKRGYFRVSGLWGATGVVFSWLSCF